MSTFSFRALALIAVRVARLIRSLREKKDSSKLTRVLTIIHDTLHRAAGSMYYPTFPVPR